MGDHPAGSCGGVGMASPPPLKEKYDKIEALEALHIVMDSLSIKEILVGVAGQALVRGKDIEDIKAIMDLAAKFDRCDK